MRVPAPTPALAEPIDSELSDVHIYAGQESRPADGWAPAAAGGRSAAGFGPHSNTVGAHLKPVFTIALAAEHRAVIPAQKTGQPAHIRGIRQS